MEMTPAPIEGTSGGTRAGTKPRRVWLSLALGAIVSGVSLWLILQSVNMNATLQVLYRSNVWFVLLALLAQLAAMEISVVRWRVLLGPFPTSLQRLTQIFFSAHLLNTLLPVKLGSVARVLLAAESEKLNVGLVLGSVAIEKVLDLVVMLLLMLILAPFVPMPGWARDSLMVGVVTLVVVLAGLVLVTRLREQILALLGRIEGRVLGEGSLRSERFVRGLLESLENLTQRREAVQVLIWTGVIWLAGGLVNQLLFWALGIQAPWSAAWFVIVVLQIGTRIPALPANLGVFHYLVILALGVYGVGESEALAYAILLHLVVFILPALAGAVLALPLSARLFALVTGRGAQEALGRSS
jgi:uncharacterized protein (TIRG00374 family)